MKPWRALFKEWRGEQAGQIPALDGLRALAITLVIFGQCKFDFIYASGSPKPGWFFWVPGYAWTGVDLFFILSGFLIGRILLKEYQKSGTIKVVPFLLKRGFRIWPLYYFVCLVTLVKLAFTHALPTLSKVMPDFFFMTNYTGETLSYGSWSLSLEEQFYILISVFLLVARPWFKITVNRMLPFFAFLLFLQPLARMTVWISQMHLHTDPFTLEWDMLHNYIFTHSDGLIVGFILAYFSVFFLRDDRRQYRLGVVLFSGLLITAIATYFQRVLFTYSLAAFGFGSLVWVCLSFPRNIFARFFSWPGFYVVSRFSYGMYLWYRFPLWRISRFVMQSLPAPPVVQYLSIFVITYGVAFLAAAFTYFLIERPFLELRSKVLSRQKNYEPDPLGGGWSQSKLS